jgi:hypothetical protein
VRPIEPIDKPAEPIRACAAVAAHRIRACAASASPRAESVAPEREHAVPRRRSLASRHRSLASRHRAGSGPKREPVAPTEEGCPHHVVGGRDRVLRRGSEGGRERRRGSKQRKRALRHRGSRRSRRSESLHRVLTARRGPPPPYAARICPHHPNLSSTIGIRPPVRDREPPPPPPTAAIDRCEEGGRGGSPTYCMREREREGTERCELRE